MSLDHNGRTEYSTIQIKPMLTKELKSILISSTHGTFNKSIVRDELLIRALNRIDALEARLDSYVADEAI